MAAPDTGMQAVIMMHIFGPEPPASTGVNPEVVEFLCVKALSHNAGALAWWAMPLWSLGTCLHRTHTSQMLLGVCAAAAALQSMRPGLTGGWYGPWSAQVVGASCRVAPPAGPAAAAVPPGPPRSTAGSPESSSQPRDEGAISAKASQASASAIKSKAPQQQQQQQPVCSLGQQFLQSYLDSLGSLNTFG
jgi:hypothetical protein